MKRRFFIFSLPRSGSSWLSTFLSMPGSYCYHEPFADGDWLALRTKWDNRAESCVGAIDTSAHQRFTGVDVVAAEAVCFVLHRHKRDIESSLRRRGWVMDLGKEIDQLDKLTYSTCISLYYNWFNEIRYLETIWNSITGGLPFDRERAEYLIEMNIQRSFASVSKRVTAHQNVG